MNARANLARIRATVALKNAILSKYVSDSDREIYLDVFELVLEEGLSTAYNVAGNASETQTRKEIQTLIFELEAAVMPPVKVS